MERIGEHAEGQSVIGTSSRISGANLYSRLNFWVAKSGNAALSAPPVRAVVDSMGIYLTFRERHREDHAAQNPRFV